MGARPPFAAMVKGGMERRGLGLRELCRETGVDPSFLSKVLAGKRNPPSEEDVLRRLAQALEIEPARLIAGAGRIPSEWSRLYEDEGAFDSVDRILSGPVGAYEARRSASRPASPPARTSRRDDFGEELL
jgi:transcriptional regulator with XRE-family HTH domain